MLQLHPDHLRAARGMSRVAAFVLIGRSAGAFKEMVIAYRYGISNVVDAYQITLMLVSWLPSACSAIFAIVLVPAFVDLRKQSASEEAQFLSELVTWSAVVGLGFTAILYLIWPYVLRLMAGNLAVETQDMAHHMMMVMAPIGVLIMMVTAYSTRLQSSERHIATLLDGLPAVMTLLLVLFFTGNSAMQPLMYGTLLGYVALVLVLRPLGGKVDNNYARLSFTFRSRKWPPVYHAVRVFMLGQLVVCCTPAIDQYFVAHLGDGAVATLGYANRVFGLIISMGALAIAQGTLPVLSDILGRDDHKRARHTAFQWSLLMLGAGTVCAAIAYPLAPWMVGVLFQRGAFTAQNTELVAELMRFSLVQLPFYFASLVMMNLLSVEGRYKEMAIITALGFIVKVAANTLLTRWIGMPGVVVATGVMQASVFCLSMLFTRRIPPLRPTGGLAA
ncbi:lipid II flippase MurJ [Caballeronia sp. LP006]|uniref:murein biosynthesis integral membrane protein MurJ n=2 Tax=unclassified Caballeronia TaxID=2646786 RepID=UPI00285C8559|nr:MULTISPECIES: lipid II flippase MurJ [unclassified Caballeronia]MDR5828091.1 lipid II flippase MurJ [Caballeronia sp. LP006]MDR5850065.1 lipid II flippase MurJ [Caballeronia sp. LZ003]